MFKSFALLGAGALLMVPALSEAEAGMKAPPAQAMTPDNGLVIQVGPDGVDIGDAIIGLAEEAIEENARRADRRAAERRYRSRCRRWRRWCRRGEEEACWKYERRC